MRLNQLYRARMSVETASPVPKLKRGPKPSGKVRLTVKVSPAISATIRACAKEDGTTISQVVESQFLAAPQVKPPTDQATEAG